MNRVISLAPNISEIISRLDCEGKVLGTTDHTDYGSDLGGWLNPDFQKVSGLEPDFVFTCGELQRDVKEELAQMGLEVKHYEYNRFSELFTLIDEVSRELGAEEAGLDVKNNLTERVHKVKEFVQERERPVVYCEEWDSPPMVAGNWVPEMVEIAGGDYPFLEAGERSRCVSEEQYESHSVDIFVSHLCGEGLMHDFRSFRDEWNFPEETYFLDDNYMNQLSPRTVGGIENLAAIIHGYEPKTTHHVKWSKTKEN